MIVAGIDVAVLHASPVTAQNQHPVSESVNKKPSLTQTDGNAYATVIAECGLQIAELGKNINPTW